MVNFISGCFFKENMFEQVDFEPKSPYELGFEEEILDEMLSLRDPLLHVRPSRSSFDIAKDKEYLHALYFRSNSEVPLAFGAIQTRFAGMRVLPRNPGLLECASWNDYDQRDHFDEMVRWIANIWNVDNLKLVGITKNHFDPQTHGLCVDESIDSLFATRTRASFWAAQRRFRSCEEPKKPVEYDSLTDLLYSVLPAQVVESNRGLWDFVGMIEAIPRVHTNKTYVATALDGTEYFIKVSSNQPHADTSAKASALLAKEFSSLIIPGTHFVTTGTQAAQAGNYSVTVQEFKPGKLSQTFPVEYKLAILDRIHSKAGRILSDARIALPRFTPQGIDGYVTRFRRTGDIYGAPLDVGKLHAALDYLKYSKHRDVIHGDTKGPNWHEGLCDWDRISVGDLRLDRAPPLIEDGILSPDIKRLSLDYLIHPSVEQDGLRESQRKEHINGMELLFYLAAVRENGGASLRILQGGRRADEPHKVFYEKFLRSAA